MREVRHKIDVKIIFESLELEQAFIPRGEMNSRSITSIVCDLLYLLRFESLRIHAGWHWNGNVARRNKT